MFEKRASFIWSEWRDSNARPLAPKASALPLGYTRILNNCIYTIKSGGRKGFCRCGQTCGQRPMFERFAGKGKCQNPSVCKGLRNFGILRMGGGVTRSQTRRDTNFAIPGYSLFCHDTTASGKNKVFFCLWSFMWSKPLLCRFR